MRALVGAQKERIAFGFCPVRRCYGREKQESHRRPNGPPMTFGACHAAKRIGQAGRNCENQYQFEKVRQRRGIFKRMRAIRIEKPSTVGA